MLVEPPPTTAAEPHVHEHKVHGSAALEALSRQSSLAKYSPDSTMDQIPGSGSDSDKAFSLVAADNVPSRTNSASLASLPSLEPARSKKKGLLSCFGMGASSRILSENDASVSAAEVGIRPSFYWLDSPVSEEARQSAEASARWMKSDCQDDALVIENFIGVSNLTFVGVFDGHGPYGRLAAKYCSQHLPRHLESLSQALRSRSEKKRIAAIKEACLRTDTEMQDHRTAGFDCSLSGTTVCFALLDGNKVTVANVGDSRCVVARREPDGTLSAIPLSTDAKPNLPEEARRIYASGGIVRQLMDEEGQMVGAHRVFRRGDSILPGLAMSRSLGDSYAHAVGVSAEPLITSYTLTSKDQFLVLGTDGLWDVMTCAVAADFIERYRCNRDAGVTCAEALTLEAQERWKQQHDEALVDDISVAILHLTPLPPPERVASIPRPLIRAASCNDEANQMAHSWQEGGLGSDTTNPSQHSPRRFFEHLWDDEDGSLVGAGGGRSGSTSAVQSPIKESISEEPQLQSLSLRRNNSSSSQLHHHQQQQPRLNIITRAHSNVSLHRATSTNTNPISYKRQTSNPRDITSSPISMASFRGVASRSASLPEKLEFLLRPIRKAYPSASFGTSKTLRSSSSLDPNSYCSELGLAGELTDDTPRSAGGSDRASTPSSSHRGQGERKCRGGDGVGLEGKVRRGMPRSLSAGFLSSFVGGYGGARRSSIESDRTMGSRLGSLEEVGLACVSEIDGGEETHDHLEYHI